MPEPLCNCSNLLFFLLEQDGLGEAEAMRNELRHGLVSLPDAVGGAARFAEGAGRHGDFG